MEDLKQFAKSCFVSSGILRRTITGVVLAIPLFYLLMWILLVFLPWMAGDHL